MTKLEKIEYCRAHNAIPYYWVDVEENIKWRTGMKKEVIRNHKTRLSHITDPDIIDYLNKEIESLEKDIECMNIALRTWDKDKLEKMFL